MPSESLKVGTAIDIGKELAARSSMYNPRSFGGKNYVVQINAPQRAIGCYPAGSTRYEALADIKDGAEVRMAGAFPAADYVLLAGGAGRRRIRTSSIPARWSGTLGTLGGSTK